MIDKGKLRPQLKTHNIGLLGEFVGGHNMRKSSNKFSALLRGRRRGLSLIPLPSNSLTSLIPLAVTKIVC